MSNSFKLRQSKSNNSCISKDIPVKHHVHHPTSYSVKSFMKSIYSLQSYGYVGPIHWIVGSQRAFTPPKVQWFFHFGGYSRICPNYLNLGNQSAITPVYLRTFLLHPTSYSVKSFMKINVFLTELWLCRTNRQSKGIDIQVIKGQ